ncbi:MAG TPA: hypothetical protein VHC22_04975 [Pirellulales bacterium]|nr:hypothetical protein [Pirellulales bacterium]
MKTYLPFSLLAALLLFLAALDYAGFSGSPIDVPDRGTDAVPTDHRPL